MMSSSFGGQLSFEDFSRGTHFGVSDERLISAQSYVDADWTSYFPEEQHTLNGIGLDYLRHLNYEANLIWENLLICYDRNISRIREAYFHQSFQCPGMDISSELNFLVRNIEHFFEDFYPTIVPTYMNDEGRYDLPLVHPLLGQKLIELYSKSLLETYSLVRRRSQTIRNRIFFGRDQWTHILTLGDILKGRDSLLSRVPNQSRVRELREKISKIYHLLISNKYSCNPLGLWPYLTYNIFWLNNLGILDHPTSFLIRRNNRHFYHEESGRLIEYDYSLILAGNVYFLFDSTVYPRDVFLNHELYVELNRFNVNYRNLNPSIVEGTFSSRDVSRHFGNYIIRHGEGCWLDYSDRGEVRFVEDNRRRRGSLDYHSREAYNLNRDFLETYQSFLAD